MQVNCAHSYWHRLRGLLGRPAPKAGSALEIAPCHSVHTFFMTYAIDAVFVDRDGQVVKVAEHLRPWRLCGARGARIVYEFAAGQVGELGIQVGDRCDTV